MENMNPSPSNSTQQPDSGTKETPFAQSCAHLTKQQYIQLKWDSRYWQRQHERAIVREAALKKELESAQAEIRDLKQRLYGKHSEKSSLPSEAQAGDQKSRRPRGQARGSKGHDRTPSARSVINKSSPQISSIFRSVPRTKFSFFKKLKIGFDFVQSVFFQPKNRS